MLSDPQPVTEEMVEDFYDAYMNEGGSYQNLRAEKRENERKWIIRGLEAAQAVAPPKGSPIVIRQVLETMETCGACESGAYPIDPRDAFADALANLRHIRDLLRASSPAAPATPDEKAWDEAFASPEFAALVAEARADIAAGRTEPLCVPATASTDGPEEVSTTELHMRNIGGILPDSQQAGGSASTGAAHLTHADSSGAAPATPVQVDEQDWARRLSAVELANAVQMWCEGTFRDGVAFTEVTKMFRTKIAAPATPSKSVYISGPMTGYAEFNYPKFGERAMAWRAAGWTVRNPAEHFAGSMTEPRPAYMRADVEDLLHVEAIALIDGWERSKGARLEVMIGRELALAFYNAETLVPMADALIDVKLGAAPATRPMLMLSESQQEWSEAEHIANLPDVDSAIRGFDEDPSADNGVCMVRAVLRAVRNPEPSGASGTEEGPFSAHSLPRHNKLSPPHETVPVLVWADIDAGIASAVRWLNDLGVRTLTSCEGGETYRPYVMVEHLNGNHALDTILARFDVSEGGEHWCYLHPKDGAPFDEPLAVATMRGIIGEIIGLAIAEHYFAPPEITRLIERFTVAAQASAPAGEEPLPKHWKDDHTAMCAWLEFGNVVHNETRGDLHDRIVDRMDRLAAAIWGVAALHFGGAGDRAPAVGGIS